MIKVICGGKGSGKTGAMVDLANNASATAKGIIVFIDKSKSLMHQLGHTVKLVDTSEYKVRGEQQLDTFIKGMVAVNYDIQTIFIDNIERITDQTVDKLGNLFAQLESLALMLRVDFVISIEAEKEQLPQFCSKYTD